MGAFLAQGNAISDHMLMAAAEALPSLITPEELAQGRVFPDLRNIRDISLHIAMEVIKAAADEGLVANPSALRAMGKGDKALRRYASSV